MKIIKARYEFLEELDRDYILKKIERIGRTCYKSEDRITEDSASKFVEGIVKKGHEAVIEHYSFSVRFIVDRGVSHELVRHRMSSFAQESTRYCNYSKDKFGKEITVIKPIDSNYYIDDYNYEIWRQSCLNAESAYFAMLDRGASPQEARSVLPNSLKTEIVVTANLREWRHILKLRTSKAAHPQIREVMLPLLHDLQQILPEMFSDIQGGE